MITVNPRVSSTINTTPSHYTVRTDHRKLETAMLTGLTSAAATPGTRTLWIS